MAIRPRHLIVDEPPPAPAAPVALRTDVPRAARAPTSLRPVSVGLPPALYEESLAYAQSQGRPLAVVLRTILSDGLSAAIGSVGGVGRPSAAQGLGGVARRRP
jgi:hypothetical protein